jgi:hypothetical protein
LLLSVACGSHDADSREGRSEHHLAAFQVHRLGPPGANVVIYALNDRNQVVGTVDASGGPESFVEDALTGTRTALPRFSAGPPSVATALGNDGTIAGFMATTALRWQADAGTYSVQALPGMATQPPGGVGPDGIIVGKAALGCGRGGCDERPATWTASGELFRPEAPPGMRFGNAGFSAVNAAGLTVGAGELSPEGGETAQHLFSWHPGEARITNWGAFPAWALVVRDVNDEGDLTGHFRSVFGAPNQAFVRWASGSVQELACASGCEAHAIDGTGSVYGALLTPEGKRAARWSRDAGWQPLSEITGVDLGSESEVVDVNRTGSVLLKQQSAGGTAYVLLVPRDKPAPDPILGFESPGRWNSAGVTLVSSPDHTDGTAGLGLVAPAGFISVQSDALPAETVTELLGTGAGGLALDLRLPANVTANAWWGALQLYVSAPSRGVYRAYCGQAELMGVAVETFNSYAFSIPAYVKTALAATGPLTDVTFEVVLNVPATGGTYVLDALRAEE